VQTWTNVEPVEESAPMDFASTHRDLFNAIAALDTKLQRLETSAKVTTMINPSTNY